MTQFDYSWQALLTPREKADLFAFEAESFNPEKQSFDVNNTWWMAQLCQLSYFPSKDETQGIAAQPERSEVIKKFGLKELYSIDEPGAQGYVTCLGKVNILALRGTDDINDWTFNVKTKAVSWPGGGFVHEGFLEAFENIASLLTTIRLTQPGQRWIITGHSLGAAIGVLASTILQPIQSYLFGCPKLGDEQFCNSINSNQLFDIRNEMDLVSTIPDAMGSVKFKRPGTGIWLHDGEWQVAKGPTSNSPFPDLSWSFKRITTPTDWHKPVKELSDHSIINYIAQLENLLQNYPKL